MALPKPLGIIAPVRLAQRGLVPPRSASRRSALRRSVPLRSAQEPSLYPLSVYFSCSCITIFNSSLFILMARSDYIVLIAVMQRDTYQ